MSVGVIIVNYFTEDLLRPLVQSLVGFPMIREMIVFDNGSNPLLDLGEGKARVMRQGHNIGFAAAVNRAFSSISSDYVLLLNPDLRIDAAAVERLLAASRRYQCPMVGPRFYWDDAHLFRLPPATGALRWLTVGADAPSSLDGQLRGHYWALHHDYYWFQRTPFRQPFLPGACLLLDSQWVRRRGRVFDERYFMYYEDTDLCIEAQLEGWMPLCVPGAETVHYWDQSPEPEGGKGKMMAEAGQALHQKFGLQEQGSGISPSLVPQGPDDPWLDLGQVAQAPPFALPPLRVGTRFEMAVDASFVPFAQARLGPRGLIADDDRIGLGHLAIMAAPWARKAQVRDLTLPEGLWDRMRLGRYYARLRGPDGRVTSKWQWCRVA